MLLGAALSLVTVVASYLLLAFAFRRSRQLQVAIVLGGFVLRVAMLFALLASIARFGVVDMNQLVLWLVGFYLVLVVAEARDLASDAARRPPEA